MKEPTKHGWRVSLKVFAFDTKEEAKEFEEKLIDAFCDLADGYAYAASSIVEEIQ